MQEREFIQIMKFSCGTDIIEIKRVQESIENLGDKFINKIYTENEIKYCESKNVQKYQHYAARFAAKEAIFKAISDRLENKYDIEWKDVEIINSKSGKPNVKFINKQIDGLEEIDISISHCKEYAVANVVVQFK